jgi:Zn-dependent peptidase ImmA (M78 family)
VTGPRCKSTNIIGAPEKDWMEWQAGYAAGALLMPVSALKKNAEGVLKGWGGEEILPDSQQGSELVANIATAFDVSIDAASARLKQMGILAGTMNEISPVKDEVNYR